VERAAKGLKSYSNGISSLRARFCSALLETIGLNAGVDAFMDDALNVFGEMGTRYASFFPFQYLVPDSA
jgi:hypothetical protein